MFIPPKSQLRLSGYVAGGSGLTIHAKGTIIVEGSRQQPFDIQLEAENGYWSTPRAVEIPAGQLLFASVNIDGDNPDLYPGWASLELLPHGLQDTQRGISICTGSIQSGMYPSYPQPSGQPIQSGYGEAFWWGLPATAAATDQAIYLPIGGEIASIDQMFIRVANTSGQLPLQLTLCFQPSPATASALELCTLEVLAGQAEDFHFQGITGSVDSPYQAEPGNDLNPMPRTPLSGPARWFLLRTDTNGDNTEWGIPEWDVSGLGTALPLGSDITDAEFTRRSSERRNLRKQTSENDNGWATGQRGKQPSPSRSLPKPKNPRNVKSKSILSPRAQTRAGAP